MAGFERVSGTRKTYVGGFEICLLTEGLGNQVSEGDLCWDAVEGDFVDGVLGRDFGSCFG